MFLFCLKGQYRFLQIFFFSIGTLEKHPVMHVEKLGCEFAAMFVMFIFVSYFALQICLNLTRNTSLVSREKKLTKFVYFLQKQPFADVL